MTASCPSDTDCEVAIAGAGLAGGLIALALTALRPDIRLLLFDGAERAGGNHVWSFFDSDVDDAARALLAPLVTHRWTGGYDVRFAGYTRHLATPYNSITSTAFDALLRQRLGGQLRLGMPVAKLASHSVTLADGRRIRAGGVIDARGFLSSDLPPPGAPMAGAGLICGWQKFVGQTLLLRGPHGLDRPLIMDATVDQAEGYRFAYLLPLGSREIFVEDTYYSDSSDLQIPEIERRIVAYAEGRGWTVERIVHAEHGVLPVTKGGDFDRFWPEEDRVARAGVRAGLFHPMTGYSLPLAVRFALMLAGADNLDGASLALQSRVWAARHWRSGGYYRMLGRMLFDAASPAGRHRIFERFYQLPAPLIERFYAGQSSLADKIRVLCGRPPVPIRAAMRVLTPHIPA